ncbi:phage minor head protein [Alkanindiges illinoisensis]|uniref:Phage head morphogenesis protein n=1 Tax=Alkanindiges illinoisensis TaxID=197183 RepID=A0A4Y7XE96_9GAMM|nr:phage minor head protein [Alkanindiges illinoisensis]TEU30090.1 phage head morphogenesis protein [Alkanindiges illinoisensis]
MTQTQRNQRPRHTPHRARKVEIKYGQDLRKIASYIDSLVKGFDVTNPAVYPSLVSALRHYSETLDVWATNAAGRILTDVALRDEKTWMLYAQDMSRGLRNEIRLADTGVVMQQLLADQVRLIKSLPLDAAQRVHDLATRAVIDGTRASEISGLIMATGHVTKSRANTIARTEVSRAATTFTQARALAIGSDSYIWRTSGDGDVRPSHKAINGTPIKWNDPPTLDGMTGHAGCLPNCRCYAEPIIPD